MNRTLAFLGLAFLCVAAPAFAQESPAPKDSQELVVRVHARWLASGESAGAAPTAPWEAENVKYTDQGSPAPFKLVGPNIVVFVGVTPFARKDGKGVVLIAEGQVGIKRSDGGFSYQATVSTIDVAYGEPVLFLPLGLNSPLRVEISVLKAGDLPGGSGASGSSEPAPGSLPGPSPTPSSSPAAGSTPDQRTGR